MAVILLGWISAVALVLTWVARPWKNTPARAPLPLILAVAVSIWVLGSGAVVYNDLIAEHLWTAASVAIGFVPAKALLFALLAYAAGRAFLHARATPGPAMPRWAPTAALSAICLYLLSMDAEFQYNAALERHARSETLSAEDVSVLAQKIRNGDARRDEQGAFLGNRLCPPDLLAAFAASTDARWRRAVARNDKINPDIADKLSQDSDEQVRFMLAFNRALPPPLLSRLAADTDEMVRQTVAWTHSLPDADFDKLVNDPSPDVRGIAAIQPRLTDEQRQRLRNDPVEHVRDAANRWQAQ